MLEIKGVKKSYGEFQLDCSLNVEKGRITGLVGENGAGKSTVFKAVLGLISYDGGEIKIPVKLGPAWLVSEEDNNPYNLKTKEVLGKFKDLHIPIGSGNIVFPSGNALKYLSEYFEDGVAYSSPYEEDIFDVRAISFSPNGDVLNGNINNNDIQDILESYRP